MKDNTDDLYLIPFYKRFPVHFVEGKGHLLVDERGKEYIDFSAGISVVNFGHQNPEVKAAMKNQLDKITHISNLFEIPEQNELGRFISEKSFNGKSFFCNSGAEANDGVIKIVRFIGNGKKSGKNKIIALEGSFHGRTIATVSMTGQEKYRKGFEPLLENITFVKFNDMSSLEAAFDESVCAIFLEAVQGEGGVRPLSRAFVAKAKNLAKRFDALLVFDEVQAGMGRTGKYFAYQWFDISPDIITLAKSLGNGMPVGAIHVRPEIADLLPAGLHASTFGGNYLAMAAGLAVMKLLNEDMLKKINLLSAYLQDSLNGLRKDKVHVIGDIRIKGLMAGIDLIGVDVLYVIKELLEKGIVTLRAGENALRLLPPFTINEKEIDILIDALRDIL